MIKLSRFNARSLNRCKPVKLFATLNILLQLNSGPMDAQNLSSKECHMLRYFSLFVHHVNGVLHQLHWLTFDNTKKFRFWLRIHLFPMKMSQLPTMSCPQQCFWGLLSLAYWGSYASRLWPLMITKLAGHISSITTVCGVDFATIFHDYQQTFVVRGPTTMPTCYARRQLWWLWQTPTLAPILESFEALFLHTKFILPIQILHVLVGIRRN